MSSVALPSPTIRCMKLEGPVARYLTENKIPHEIMECDPALADTAQFCEAYGIPLDRSANAILVASKKPLGEYAVCLLLATDRLDVNGTVRKKLGVRKLSFASAEETLDKTDMEIGGVTVFGLPPDLPVWVDHGVLKPDWVVVGAGTRSAKIKVDPAVFGRLEGFEIIPDLVQTPAL